MTNAQAEMPTRTATPPAGPPGNPCWPRRFAVLANSAACWGWTPPWRPRPAGGRRSFRCWFRGRSWPASVPATRPTRSCRRSCPGRPKRPRRPATGRSARRGRGPLCGPGLLRKYQGRILMVATRSCAVHCRFCFRRHFPYASERGQSNGCRRRPSPHCNGGAANCACSK